MNEPAGLSLLMLTELFLPTKGGTAVSFDDDFRRLGGKSVHVVTAAVPGGDGPGLLRRRHAPGDVFVLTDDHAGQAREADARDVQAIAETVKGFELIAWFAMFAPAGTPQAIVDRLAAESEKILARNDVRERFAVLGIQVDPMKPAALGKFQQSELEKWARLAKAANIVPE